MFKYDTSDIIALIGGIIIIVVISILLKKFLGNKGEKVKKIPLQVLAVIIVLLEIAKQIYYFIKFKQTGVFDKYVLPIHFCSLFIILFPFVQFTKKKYADFLRPMPMCYAVIMALMLYINPHALLGNACSNIFANFHNFHTYAFHHVVLAYFAFSIALDDYTPHKNDWIKCLIGAGIYALYAVPLAYLLNTNYVNILSSAFGPLESIRLSMVNDIGYVLAQIIYDLIMAVVASLTLFLISKCYYLIYKKVKNKVSK